MVKLQHVSAAGREVDVVLEDRRGNVAGIEIRLSASLNSSSVSGLKALREMAGKHFRSGVVLYTGCDRVPFGKDLQALPISALWERHH